MGEYGKHWQLVKAGFCALCFAAAAPVEACRLALVLALDVSISVDAQEDRLQRSGLAAALTSPEVQDAFFVSSDPIALLVFEWSGHRHQEVLLDWTEIATPGDLRDAAEVIAASQRAADNLPTAMGHALGYAAMRLQERADCKAMTIDLAGDGRNNLGFTPTQAYAAFPFDGVTVNGLIVDGSLMQSRAEIVTFFEDTVIRGPGAFVEIARNYADYEATIRRKLVRELLAAMVGQIDADGGTPRG